jgi:allantoin racemase
VIFGGGPLAGLADKVKDRIDVPVVDPLAAAVKQAEALHTLNARKAIKGAFRRPDPKATIGLSDALARHLERKEELF